MTEERGFKGIWIPKEIWLSDLSLQEKVFLAEIDSLDNKNGCYASNSYFSKFFQISKARCSQIISALEIKKLITVSLEMKDKQVVKRKLRVVEGVVNILNRGSKYSKQGSKYLHTIYNSNITKVEDKSSTNNIISHKKITPSLFDKFWELYPRKKGTSKAKALTSWNKLCNKSNKERPDWKVIKKAIKSQSKSERWRNQPQYIPHPTTWLNQSRWLDDADSLNEITSFEKDKDYTYHGGYKLTKETSKI